MVSSIYAIVDVEDVVPNSEQRWISYAEFGERFVRHAVTAGRIAEAVAGMTGRGMTIGPFGIGPLGLASVRADGKVNAPAVAPAGPDVSFTLSVPVTLELALTLGGKQLKLGALVEVVLRLHARTAEPLLIVIDIPVVRARDVKFSVRAEAIGAAFESMVDPISGIIRREVAARVNAMLADQASVRARVFDIGARIEGQDGAAPLPPYQWSSAAEFGQRFFRLAVTQERIAQQLKELDGRPVTVGPLRGGPREIAQISVDGRLGLPQLAPVQAELVTYALRIPLSLDIVIKALGTGRFRAEVEIALTLTARASGGPAGDGLVIEIDVPPPVPASIAVTITAQNFWARRIGEKRVRGELAAQVARVVSAELASSAHRSVDVGALIDAAVPADEAIVDAK